MDDLIDVVYSDAQAFQDMGSGFGLVQVILRTSDDNVDLVLDIAFQHFLHTGKSWGAVDQHNVVYRKVGLHR